MSWRNDANGNSGPVPGLRRNTQKRWKKRVKSATQRTEHSSPEAQTLLTFGTCLIKRLQPFQGLIVAARGCGDITPQPITSLLRFSSFSLPRVTTTLETDDRAKDCRHGSHSSHAVLSTTCLVVSQPASTYTINYSSGDFGLFPATTYTAPTARVYTDSATIKARCLTLAPGQTIPPSVSFVGVACSTDYHAGSIETTTYSYTPGESFSAFGETLFVYTGTTTRLRHHHPHVRPDFPGVQPLPDVWSSATCSSVTPLTWSSLIITFVAVQLSWWLFDRAAAVAEETTHGGGRLAGWLPSVCPNCRRLGVRAANAPGCAGLYALAAGRDTGEYAALYYMGVRRRGDGLAPQFSTWKLATCVGADLLALLPPL